jgi:ABC-type multidrug transport system fused ATPase/permease subunit
MTLDSSKSKRLWKYLRPYWHFELITLIVMAMLAALTLAIPLAIAYLIDDLIPSLAASKTGIDVKPVILFGLLLIGIYLTQVVLSWVRDYLATYIGANIIADIRAQLFGHLERLPLSFFSRHQIGEIMSRMLSDVNMLQNLLTTILLMAITNVLMLIAILVYLLKTNWLLTLIAVIPVPLTVWLTGAFGRKLYGIVKRIQEIIAQLSANVQESLTAVTIVKAFGQEDRELDKVKGTMRGLTRSIVRHGVTNSLASNLINFVNSCGPIVILAWGTYLAAGGSMKIGTLIAFYMLLTYLYSPIQGLASVQIEVKSAMASVDRIFEYLDIPQGIEESANPVHIEQLRGNIVVENVSFGYSADSFLFRDFTLTIRAKEKVAIVGTSGSGKTTLANLIMRFYDPQSGRIMLDDVDIKEVSLETLRRNIGLVGQDPLLFRMTIEENIAFSKPDATCEDIRRAAEIANIHDFISGLPDGYKTEVGERGVTLSGGERQRICLARAILKKPSIFILDEATSALDSRSENLIQEALTNILRDKTAIMIAHRLSTIQHADRIVAIERGKIVDEGIHSDLLRRSEYYRELAKTQLMTDVPRRR